MIALKRALTRDLRGATIVEFALVAPVMLVLCLGLCELAFQGYVQSVLTGAVEKAGRDSTVESNVGTTSKLDDVVQQQLKALVPNAKFTFARKNYDNYGAMAGEPFIDSPDPTTSAYDGICNHGETYTDVNGNGKYDTSLADDGQGGANDVTLYTVSVQFARLFPLGSLAGLGSDVTLVASTTLKSQPFNNQAQNTGQKSGICS